MVASYCLWGLAAAAQAIFVLVSGPSVRNGEPAAPPDIVDVAVTALVHAGTEIDPAWQLDGRVLGLERHD